MDVQCFDSLMELVVVVVERSERHHQHGWLNFQTKMTIYLPAVHLDPVCDVVVVSLSGNKNKG
jgi:hypothetical protein